MPTPHPLAGQEILFTQQHHFADRAGEHFDYRLVLGDKAYSWASRKDVPEPGKAIVLFEQPVHDRNYALSSEIEIPKGSYGSGRTLLSFVRKAQVQPETEPDKLVIKAGDERYLLKKLDEAKYGAGKPWLFKNLAPYKEGPDSTLTHDGNNYLVDDAIEQSKASKIEHLPVSKLAWMLEHGTPTPERLVVANTKVPVLVTNWQDKVAVIDGFHRLHKAREEGLETIPTRYVDTGKLKAYTRQKLAALSPELEAKFKPDFTPEQMKALGVLRHPGSKYNPEVDNVPEKNFFGVRASLDVWPEKWHRPEHELGWVQWYEGYAAGKRGPDDERQIKRWLSFKARHLAQVKKADPSLNDDSIRPKQKQSLLNWSVAVGDKNKYLQKIAAVFYHATQEENIHNILSAGQLMPLAEVMKRNKDLLVKVESMPRPWDREYLTAEEAVKKMEGIKEIDKVFFTKGKYIPAYGKYVIRLQLNGLEKRKTLNTIPEEHTSKEIHDLAGGKVYVPYHKVKKLQALYPEVKIVPVGRLKGKTIRSKQRVEGYPKKIIEYIAK